MTKQRWYKCTRPDGTDFYSGTINYADALESGKPIEIDATPATGKVCGHGMHVSPTPCQTIRFANRSHRPWRWFEVAVDPANIVEQDKDKARVRALRVVREIRMIDL